MNPCARMLSAGIAASLAVSSFLPLPLSPPEK